MMNSEALRWRASFRVYSARWFARGKRQSDFDESQRAWNIYMSLIDVDGLLKSPDGSNADGHT